MAFTVSIDDADAAALRRQAAAEDRSVEDVVHDAIRAHLARTATDLDAEVAAVRADADFMARAEALVERDRGILDRLAE